MVVPPALRRTILAACLCPVLACEPVSGTHDNSEIISHVELTFTPVGGGTPVVASFTDPDGDGGASGEAEPIDLAVGTQYELTIRVLNDLVDPALDITDEIQAEAEEHQFFIAGDGVAGPASESAASLVTHAYNDKESDYGDDAVGDDLPLGVSNLITATTTGDSELRVVLRHLPELNGAAQKEPGLAGDFAAGISLPGDVDVDVRFVLGVM